MNPTALSVIFLSTAVIILILLSNFGMAKWFSVLFSDARNKLGDQIVFSNWKGRPTMRAYKIPANPNTLPQQAQRDKNRQMVLAYQTNVKSVSESIAIWNELALPRQISGFNLFGKYGLRIDIASIDAGAAPFDNTITYTIPIDLSVMGMYRTLDGADPVEIVPPGSLEAGTDAQFEDMALAAGTYVYFIGPGTAFDPPVSALAPLCANWKANPTTGLAVTATTIVS